MSQFWNGEVLAAPNLITVCVDESQASEISGRLYHGYSQEPQSFENVVQLIRYMADFYDSIRFPESSVVLREFSPEKRAMEKLHEKSVEYQQLMEQNGICATFHIFVKYRQNATWQGSVEWPEGRRRVNFRSVLELGEMLLETLERMDKPGRWVSRRPVDGERLLRGSRPAGE